MMMVCMCAASVQLAGRVGWDGERADVRWVGREEGREGGAV